jgi:hypothetical protein
MALSAPGGRPEFAVLEAGRSEDRATWMALWESWPEREVHAHPGYVELFAGRDERPVAATWSGPGGRVLYPLILRELALEQDPASRSTAMCDLVTPYGYGGPFFWGTEDRDRLGTEFWEAYRSWAVRQGVVSEFARLSLCGEQILTWPGPVEPKLLNVVRSLEPDLEAIWGDYEHKVRKNVQAARRAGVHVEIDPLGNELARFVEIYLGTLDRRVAGAEYYFSRDFFERLRRGLAGHYCFFHARAGERIVSTELVLLSSGIVYSFLGGTESDAFGLRPNDLVKHEIIVWAKQRGARRYVLGGGHADGDGIFRYKRAFAPHGLMRFHVGQRVHCAMNYRALIDARRRRELRAGRDWVPKPDYFPEYRA